VPLALFDLDNTLADRSAAFRRWLASFMAEHDVAADLQPWLVKADGDGFVPRPVFLGRAKEHLGLSASVESLAESYDATYPACYVREDASIAALQQLRDAGWRVAIVTNGRTAQQRAKALRTGLAEMADAFCVSEELGVRKPDSRIFQEAARECGVALEGWMIGDSAEADVAGGAAVGLRTIWLARGRTWGATLPRPDATVTTVSEAVGSLLGRDALRD
jgi:FMN phosphatase YigB (HAD superfamily)